MWEGQETRKTVGREICTLSISAPVGEKSVENTLATELNPFTFSYVINIENCKPDSDTGSWWQ